MDPLEALAKALARSDCNVALTGAGISTPSGIPDFRGPGGLWSRVDPDKFDISYFRRHPDEVWGLFVEHFIPLLDAKPNPAHVALAQLEEMGRLCAVITQNIDGLHQAAGSRNVVELHGNMRYARCPLCGEYYDMRAVASRFNGRAPRCPRCGSVLKPDVVFFGEELPADAFRLALEYAENARVFIVVGSSLYVAPANQLPLVAKRNGALLAIINMGPTEYDHEADLLIRARVEEALPRLVGLVRALS